jgi:hypothetical protein
MSIKQFGNSGAEDGFSQQCMLISILDYLRKKTNTLPGMSLRQFRKDNNITPARWGEQSEFDNVNVEMVKILQELSTKYKLNIYLRNLITNSNGIKSLGEAKQIDTLNYKVAYTDIYIIRYPGHFQLLDENTRTTIEDYTYVPVTINPQIELQRIKKEKADNIKLYKIVKGNKKFYTFLLDTYYNTYIQLLSSIKGDINVITESQIMGVIQAIQEIKNKLQGQNIDAWCTYNCKGATSEYTRNTPYSIDNMITIITLYDTFIKSDHSTETFQITENGMIHKITFTKDPQQAIGKKCLLLKY